MRLGLSVVAVLVAACSAGGAGGLGTSGTSSPRGGAVAEAASPAPTVHRPRPIVRPFDAVAALRFATRLAREVGPRPAGSAADVAARRLVAGELRRAGWRVVEEPVVLPQGGRTANVVAWRGAGRPTGAHVVLGGHLDTVAGSPGANDNASGVAVLVGAVRELADEPLALPVVVVAFGAEEYQPSVPRRHHVGSEAYAVAHAEQVVAALVVDMVGHGRVTCICWLGHGQDTLAARLAVLAPEAGFEVRRRGDISDHGPFARRGAPAAMLWSGRDPRGHTPGDTPDRLHVEDIGRAGALTLRFLRDLSAADADGLERQSPMR